MYLIGTYVSPRLRVFLVGRENEPASTSSKIMLVQRVWFRAPRNRALYSVLHKASIPPALLGTEYHVPDQQPCTFLRLPNKRRRTATESMEKEEGKAMKPVQLTGTTKSIPRPCCKGNSPRALMV